MADPALEFLEKQTVLVVDAFIAMEDEIRAVAARFRDSEETTKEV